MATWEFLTVPDELVSVAELIAGHFSNYGYAVAAEKHKTEFPYTPTLHCKRRSRTLLIEIAGNVDINRAEEWARFAKSTGRDTRVAIGLPGNTSIDVEADTALREFGVGLYKVEASGVIEVIWPKDLGMQVELPDRTRLKKSLRRDLGEAYDKLEKSEWLEAFEELCKVLEEAARKRLIASIGTNRVTLRHPSGRLWTPPQGEINGMSMGDLKRAYLAIQNPNRADSQLGKALATINPDRIKAAHRKGGARAKTQLRAKVGSQMWLIVNALREVY